MDLALNQGDRIRIKTQLGPYMDIQHVGYESLGITLNSYSGYIEIRKKNNQHKIFQFPKKAYKKEHDFGWWKDAEVVYSFNPNGKDKADD